MTADNHLHTRFSPDASGDAEEYILAAIAANAKHLAFTEHVDLLYFDPSFKMCDLNEYFAHMNMLKNKYADRISLSAGLEIGYTAENKLLNKELVSKFAPDYVINSVHEVNGIDCYFKKFFVNTTPLAAAEEYLNTVLESLDAPYPYHAVGHLGYVTRNAPYEMNLSELCPELIKKILTKIINGGKILELNTSCIKPLDKSIPSRDVLKLYVSLGGKKICFSSDAHKPYDLFRNYEYFRQLCRESNITSQTVIINGNETALPL